MRDWASPNTRNEELIANLEARGMAIPEGKHKGRGKGETVRKQMLEMIDDMIDRLID